MSQNTPDKTMTFYSIQHGQPRPYADHEYVDEVEITSHLPYHKNWKPTEDMMRQWMKGFFPWTEKGEGNWASTFLISLECIAFEGNTSRWRIHRRAAYTD